MTFAMLCSLCSEGLWHGLDGSLVSGEGCCYTSGNRFPCLVCQHGQSVFSSEILKLVLVLI